MITRVKISAVNVSDGHDQVDHVGSRADFNTVGTVKVQNRQREKLLQHPSASEPAHSPEATVWSIRIFVCPYIVQKGIADSRPSVLAVHGVYCLAKLGRAGLVDAAGVDPLTVLVRVNHSGQAHDMLKSILHCLRTCPFKLPEANSLLRQTQLNVLNRHFLDAPRVGEDSIRRDIITKKLYKFEFGGAEQAHCELS